MSVEQRVAELGLEFPPEPLLPNGVRVPFEWVRIVGERCVISGHGALGADGAPAGPFGRVPSEVPLEAAQQSARAAVLAILGSLRRTLGSLDRISDWVSLSGFVNADPGYPHSTAVLNAASDLPTRGVRGERQARAHGDRGGGVGAELAGGDIG